MSLIEIASFVGAAAWLYPIYVEMRKIFNKPIIKIFSNDFIELGYTNFGPVIYLYAAIITERGDTLIVRIELEIKHEDGDVRILSWRTMAEPQFQFRSFTGEGGSIEKMLPATALKIDPKIQVDKKFGFTDLKYQEKSQELQKKVAKRLVHLNKIGSADISSDLFKSEEFMELNDYFEKGMYWKNGKFDLCTKIYIDSSTKPFVKEFSFSLNNEEVDFLKANTKLLIPLFKEYIPKKIEPNWNWVFPQLVKK